jgi:hypothetical protein
MSETKMVHAGAARFTIVFGVVIVTVARRRFGSISAFCADAPTPRSPEAWGRLSNDERQAIFPAYQAINQAPGVTPGVVLHAADETEVRPIGQP